MYSIHTMWLTLKWTGELVFSEHQHLIWYEWLLRICGKSCRKYFFFLYFNTVMIGVRIQLGFQIIFLFLEFLVQNECKTSDHNSHVFCHCVANWLWIKMEKRNLVQYLAQAHFEHVDLRSRGSNHRPYDSQTTHSTSWFYLLNHCCPKTWSTTLWETLLWKLLK